MKLEVAKGGGRVAERNDSEKRVPETCTAGPEAELETRKATQQSACWGNVKRVICSTALALRAENRPTQTVLRLCTLNRALYEEA